MLAKQFPFALFAILVETTSLQHLEEYDDIPFAQLQKHTDNILSGRDVPTYANESEHKYPKTALLVLLWEAQ